VFNGTSVMLTSALEQNADIAKWNSCNMYSPGYRDQHCAPGSHKNNLTCSIDREYKNKNSTLVLKSMV
jgi:hypothetical protein